ncbi:hypothetical protein [Cellulomonas xylanilytica]|uniref:Uncharacterized protein n=1 Tax=Cellulomonas xylanilytica TaxID=233583 RepID=A0A510V6E7_9CELL|nr:hypothetical protein [Cellulomonas xylanilytica]GEK22443.1 hypothetical protein CXY01_29630 [Cellulomonas xylanilytica]
MSDTGRPGPERPAGPPTPPISNWQVAQPTPPTASIPASEPAAPSSPTRASVRENASAEAAPAPPTSERPRWLVPAIIGVVVLVIAAIVIGILVSRSGDDTADGSPAAASTILLPSPTPTVEPVARPATTAFAVALPTSVLQYALATSAVDTEWQAAGAVEAYTETYTDGGAGTVTVRSGQWETPEETNAVAATLMAALPVATTPAPSASSEGPALPQSGEVVTADGTVAGTFSMADAGDGTGVAVWTNGTTIFQVTAPVEDIADVYSAFPL